MTEAGGGTSVSRSCVSQDGGWNSSGGGEPDDGVIGKVEPGSGGEFMVVVGQEMMMLPTQSRSTKFPLPMRPPGLRVTPLLESLDSRSRNELDEFLLIGYGHLFRPPSKSTGFQPGLLPIVYSLSDTNRTYGPTKYS